MQAGLTPEELFDIVSEYEALGIHRTGSDVDRSTVEWLGAKLLELGLEVQTTPVPFAKWRCQGEVLVGERSMDFLAVPYEWVGSIDTTNVAIIDLDPRLGGDISVLAEPVQAAREAGFEAVVCATRHPTGLLRGINRPLGLATGSFPVFLVAGELLPELRATEVRVRATAETVQSNTCNMFASNNRAGKRLMLTTPLTGWFTCAGERGTGIAVLLDLVARLASELPILAVATGGHELGCFGAHHLTDEWLSTESDGRPTDHPLASIGAILHIGASVAAEHLVNGDRQLIPTRVSMTSLDDEKSSPIADALRAIELNLTASSTTWIGEAEAWSELGLPMVSISGAGNEFHTPNDLAATVTSPNALRRVADAFFAASRALYDAAE